MSWHLYDPPYSPEHDVRTKICEEKSRESKRIRTHNLHKITSFESLSRKDRLGSFCSTFDPKNCVKMSLESVFANPPPLVGVENKEAGIADKERSSISSGNSSTLPCFSH